MGEHTLQTLVPNTSLKGVLSHPGASSSGLAGEDVPDDDAGHQAQSEAAELHDAGQQAHHAVRPAWPHELQDTCHMGYENPNHHEP